MNEMYGLSGEDLEVLKIGDKLRIIGGTYKGLIVEVLNIYDTPKETVIIVKQPGNMEWLRMLTHKQVVMYKEED